MSGESKKFRLEDITKHHNPEVKIGTKEMWTQTRGELLGFASFLERNAAQVTAAQVRTAVLRGDILERVREILHRIFRGEETVQAHPLNVFLEFRRELEEMADGLFDPENKAKPLDPQSSGG